MWDFMLSVVILLSVGLLLSVGFYVKCGDIVKCGIHSLADTKIGLLTLSDTFPESLSISPRRA